MTDGLNRANDIGLADVLQQLGAELREAADRGGQTISWISAEIEMEVAVENSGTGGLRFWVVNGEASRSSTRTTHVKVSLTPHQNHDQTYGVGK